MEIIIYGGGGSSLEQAESVGLAAVHLCLEDARALGLDRLGTEHARFSFCGGRWLGG